MTKLGLTLNEVKTSVRDARTERFDFLGYTFGPHYYCPVVCLDETSKQLIAETRVPTRRPGAAGLQDPR